MLQLLLLLPAVVADPFWMTADLMRVDWSEGCLTTAGCSHPKFEILGDLPSLTEEISISWPISEHFVQDTSRPFVSHWAKGKPEDLKLKCQVVGTDPLYGFPRVCDHTASFRAFPDEIDETLERRRRQAAIMTTSMPKEELGKRLIEIRARCFNATVAVEKHTERCPWCPDPSDVALIEHRLPEDPSSAFSTSFFSRLKSDDKILHASVLILAGISILTSLSFACALVALLRQTSKDALPSIFHQAAEFQRKKIDTKYHGSKHFRSLTAYRPHQNRRRHHRWTLHRHLVHRRRLSIRTASHPGAR